MSAKVLFVDDEEANLVVCEAACADEFHVLTARGADAALDWLRREEVAVVVADQRMPGITGVELLERVRKEYPDAIRLLITAYADMPATIDAINRGHVRRYLKKPWEPHELRSAIRDALDVYDMSIKLRELERRLTQTERLYALGVVAASIGHELKNPLFCILSNLEHAREEIAHLDRKIGTGKLDPFELKTHVTDIRESIEDVGGGAERVRDILAGVELSARTRAETEAVDLGEVLRLALRLVYSEVRRIATLQVDVRPTPKVTASSTKLGQVALNLLVNAIQALDGRSRDTNAMSIRLRSEGSWVCLEIADNGPGVNERDRERIFDPFFTTKRDVGTGLGLAISRAIAQEFGGQLEVGRDEELGGAVFRLRLPAL